MRRNQSSASGSDMSTVSATWSYVLPSLNYIMRDPYDSPDGKAPVLPVAQHAGIYTVVYNFATASRGAIAGIPGFGASGATGMREGFDLEMEATMDKFERVRAMIGYELYHLLEEYFRDLAREIRLGAPLPPQSSSNALSTSSSKAQAAKGPKSKNKGKAPLATAAPTPVVALGEELSLISYYTKAYTRFSSGAAQINRVFAYLNRHFILRAIDEGCGWICLADVVAASVLKDLASVSISSPRLPSYQPLKREKPLANALASNKKTKEDLKKLEARKHAEWRNWGYDASIIPANEEEKKQAEQDRKVAEMCAEAAAPVDRIITVGALAMRCWRLEIAEPLLDALYANTNGDKDRWYGIGPIPPTPLFEKDRITDSSSNPDVSCHHNHRTLNLPIVLPSNHNCNGRDGNGINGLGEPDAAGKGKGKVKNSLYDMSLSLPFSLPSSPVDHPNDYHSGHSGSGGTSPTDDGHEHPLNALPTSANGRSTSTTRPAASTTVQVTSNKKKRPGPRKGGQSGGPPQSLAAVKAATQAAIASQAAEGNDNPSDAPPVRSRLSRSVQILLEMSTDDNATVSPDTPLNSSPLTTTMKVSHASAVADSLKMCGIGPDNAVRKRLDRFLSKHERDLHFKSKANK
ncbi:hypothetical protein FRC03_011000 [Tulasnella sp. 419]|nr:hypothetical protein FRC03_011000 [Tulasnella sp. 419]